MKRRLNDLISDVGFRNAADLDYAISGYGNPNAHPQCKS